MTSLTLIVNTNFVLGIILVLFTIYRAVSYYKHQQTRSHSETVSVQDRTGSRFIEVTYAGVYIAALYTVFTSPASPWLVLSGLLCMLWAWMLRQRALVDLSANYGHEIELFAEHELVTTGIYKHMRHPLYLGLCVDTFGAALIASSLYGIIFFAAFVLTVWRRIPLEDQALNQHFGKDAQSYQKQVASFRFWPFL